MQPSESGLWREVLGKLRELQDEMRHVEELVYAEIAEAPPASAAPPVVAPTAPSPYQARAPQHYSPLSAEPAVITLATAPRLVGRIRRALDADPLRALDLSYPPELFAPGVPPDRVQRECLHRHALNTARLAMHVASHHGYEPSTVEAIGLCALLHDVGMAHTPPELFVKTGPLTPEEVEALQAHTVEGAEMLRADRELDGLLRAVVSAVVRQHHERADGSGYPDGLDAPHIHEFAHLLALVEAYETMVTPRPYRQPCLPNEAMETLLLEAFGRAGRPARFDQRLASAFVRALSLYPIGSGVCLATGEMGQVVGSNPDDPARPHVRVLWGQDGQPLERPHVVDLCAAGTPVRRAIALPAPGTEPTAKRLL